MGVHVCDRCGKAFSAASSLRLHAKRARGCGEKVRRGDISVRAGTVFGQHRAMPPRKGGNSSVCVCDAGRNIVRQFCRGAKLSATAQRVAMEWVACNGDGTVTESGYHRTKLSSGRVDELFALVYGRRWAGLEATLQRYGLQLGGARPGVDGPHHAYWCECAKTEMGVGAHHDPGDGLLVQLVGSKKARLGPDVPTASGDSGSTIQVSATLCLL